MNVKMNGKNFDITEGMIEYIQKKMSYFEKFLKEDDTIIANVSKRKNIQKLQVYFNYKGTTVKVKTEGTDFYVLVDEILDILKNKMSKLHDLKVKKERETIKLVDIEEDISEEENSDLHIVKRKEFTLKPMSEEEAILQMNLLGHQSFIFRNADLNDMICMLYKRKDNQYGIIETF